MALRAEPMPAGRATLELSRVALESFRSYAAAVLEPDLGLTVVAAPNGAGKTNLLEAIHVAITGRSHRAGVGSTSSWSGTGWDSDASGSSWRAVRRPVARPSSSSCPASPRRPEFGSG